MLIASSAEMKYMIALTDGSSNVIIEELGDDIATKSTDLGYEEVPEEIVERTAIEQADIAKKLIPELVIYTIGYDIDDEDTVNVEKILTNVASVDKNGNRLYYKAGVNSSEVVQNLQSVMSTVTENITNNIESTDSTSEVEDNTIVNLVDTIPQECELLENSLEQDSQNIVENVSSDKKSIIWQYPNEQTSDKVYNMSFVMTLSKDALANMSIPEDAKEIEILTNGNTIDIKSINYEKNQYEDIITIDINEETTDKEIATEETVSVGISAKFIVIGAFAGIIIAMCAIVLIYIVDGRLKTDKELKMMYEIGRASCRERV